MKTTKITIVQISIFLSFLSGFLSLSLEVIWIRLFSFSLLSLPQAFSLALSFFLLGIAIGSLIGKGMCNRGKATISNIGYIFFISALFDCFIIFLLSAFIIPSPFSTTLFSLFIFIIATLRGIIFPMVHHLGSENKKSGAAISNVYFANVFGCTIAPIFIGFYLLNIISTQQTYLTIIILTFLTAFFCIKKPHIKIAIFSLILLIVPITLLLPEKIILHLSNKPDFSIKKIIENKHGIIQIYQDNENNKVVYGGNVYDGMLNIDLLKNSNAIDRAYLLPVIAPKAKNVLVIGLSTGSWARILTSMPTLESITIVELNPSYVDLASFYPEMAAVLQDKRINIITDDGRRWLNRNPGKKFDFILMNTTFHWRNYASNLLSKEFLTLSKSHLNDNGFIYFNTTGSYDAYYTSQSVFPYVYQYKNMSLASLQPILQPREKDIYTVFSKLKWQNNKNIFDSDEILNAAVNKQLESPITPYRQIDFSHLKREPEIITDKNMITEYKYGLLFSKDEK